MNNNKPKNTNTLNNTNLIGNEVHRHYLETQVEFAIAQRGGSFIPNAFPPQVNRLVNNVNLLTSQEKKQLIFFGNIFNN